MTGAFDPSASLPRAPLLYLDSNVLLPQYLRCVFLELAEAALVHVHWSDEILVEVRRNLIGPRQRRAPAKVEQLLASMAGTFPSALVQHVEELEPFFRGKTDPKDTHVAAGALRLSLAASVPQEVWLVTSNLKHLPASAFIGTRVRSISPDRALQDLLAIRPDAVDVLAAMARRFRAPPVSRRDLLAILDRSGCMAFSAALGAAWGYGIGP